ncbi:HtaA domain-containing protein [Streptomyces sp. NPDC088789]|uniref:HtaA domain-containing protein n=1 Tax=Streptomyces sp. NPDC088789 TaxID=3365899 RepID=UPI0037F3941A
MSPPPPPLPSLSPLSPLPSSLSSPSSLSRRQGRPGGRRYGWIAVLCLAVLGALLPAGAASAASSPVQGGRLDWGIKASFQTYVTGPIAQGSYTLTGGAATVGASQFRFHSATGSYDGGTGAFSAGFSGGVRFLGHRTDSGAHELDMTISRPTVRVSGGSGTLYADVTSKAKGTGAVTTSRQVPFASLSLGGIDMKGGGTAVALNNLPATLTAEGAKSFAGYYSAGTPLDPVSLSADIAAVPKTSAPGAGESPGEKGGAKDAQGKGGAAGKPVRDGAVDWGVRRTYREYVTGDIAQGEWTLSSGAQDGGALFRFPDGEGTYTGGDLKTEFTGEIRFTGAHGLDLRLSGFRVTVTDGRGTLHADVDGKGVKSAGEVPLVTFAARDLKPEDGLVTLTEAPTKLTASGAEAFGGMYQKGTEMDPVSLAVALTEDAKLPALPDLGSPASPGPERSGASDRADPSTEPVANAGDGSGFPTLPVTLAAALLLAVAAALAYVLRTRSTRSTGSTGSTGRTDRTGSTGRTDRTGATGATDRTPTTDS